MKLLAACFLESYKEDGSDLRDQWLRGPLSNNAKKALHKGDSLNIIINNYGIIKMQVPDGNCHNGYFAKAFREHSGEAEHWQDRL